MIAKVVHIFGGDQEATLICQGAGTVITSSAAKATVAGVIVRGVAR